MRVIFEHVNGEWDREVEMPAVPRVGDDIEINDEAHVVAAVIWSVQGTQFGGVVVRVR